MGDLVYVASPYSNPDFNIRRNRYVIVSNWVKETTGKYMDNVYYSPIYYYYRIAHSLRLADDAAFWQKHDILMMQKAERMIVLTMPGWDKSVGVKFEIDFMKKAKKPIKYISP